MKVTTKPFGAIDVDERQRLHFPYGLLGFEGMKEWVLLDAARPPFYWLQSTEAPELAFVLIDPRVFRPGYAPEVDAEELREIGVESPADALDFAIVSIPDNPAEMTANLQGPLIINRHSRLGRQAVSLNPGLEVRHPILPDLARARQEAC